MTWQPKDLMNIKREFLELALKEGSNKRDLCRRYAISPKTGYALLARHAMEGWACCTPRSTKPHHSPAQTPVALEQAVVALRTEHPGWGGRKIARRLIDTGHAPALPPSTVTCILHRHGLISAQASEAATPWHRFEHPQPNAMWQIDFKGYFQTLAGKCHPLTLLDDHSRFNLTLSGCAQPDTLSVQAHLQRVFKRYGLPLRINADNGGPWGTPRATHSSISVLSIWLIRLGIRVTHSAPYHPQTNGKLERFHRSLKAEVLAGQSFADLNAANLAFDRWREVYNHQRPHEALGMDTPITRYSVSPRPYPAALPAIEYAANDTVIEVGWNGEFEFQGQRLRASSALHRLPIAMRPDPDHDGCFDAFFCHHKLMRLNMNSTTQKP
jgi:transposase InsO family protein